jgi:hypothetical protein
MPPDAGPEEVDEKKEIIICTSEHKKTPLKIN